jgi:hypothetical protein
MRGKKVMSRLLSALFIFVVGTAMVGCGRENAPQTAAQPSPESTSCAADKLQPTYLPGGGADMDREPLIENAKWHRTIAGKETFIQILGGFSADRGDDPNVKKVMVRGHLASAGPTYLNSGTKYFLVDWNEPAPCNTQYAVITKGLQLRETVKIANSLAERTSSDY